MTAGRNYYSLHSYLKNKFGEDVYRISIDAGFTCPNRDGTKGRRGCIFCSEGSRPGYVNPGMSIPGQIEYGKRLIGKKYGVSKFIAYFQAFSNTYAPADELYSVFKAASEEEGICGIAVGTRPDCVDREKIKMLERLSESTFVIVEYGAQSMKDTTLEKINRAHTAEDTVKAVLMTLESGRIHTAAHLIFGLPDETKEDMLESVSILTGLGINGFKFHHLYVERGTILEQYYKDNKISLMERDEYIGLLLELMRVIPAGVVIHRLFGEC
ncbi:MAG: TIGR01212 family radical SAM protein, partial [Brevinematales bacterium]